MCSCLTFPFYYQGEIIKFLALILIISMCLFAVTSIILSFLSNQAPKHLNCYICCSIWFFYRYFTIGYIFVLKYVWSCAKRSSSEFWLVLSIFHLPSFTGLYLGYMFHMSQFIHIFMLFLESQASLSSSNAF